MDTLANIGLMISTASGALVTIIDFVHNVIYVFYLTVCLSVEYHFGLISKAVAQMALKHNQLFYRGAKCHFLN